MEIPIIIERIVYKNDKGFGILAVNLNAYSSKYDPSMEDVVAANIPKKTGYDNFTITTNMLDSHDKVEGRQYIAAGNFVKHEKYGPQFKADFIFQDEPKTEDGLRVFLMTLPNIKEMRSAEIIKKFGVDGTLIILDEDPMKLTAINGINEKRIPPIKDAWDKSKAQRELYFWLIDHGISPEIGRVIYETWGRDSMKVLTANPYQLTEIKGFGFVKADTIAHKIFKSVPKDSRTIACIHYVLKEDLHKNSNLCMPYSTMKITVMDALTKGSEANNPSEKMSDYLPLIPECIKKNKEKFIAVKNITEATNGAYIYLREIWDKEKYIAEHIYHRHNKKVSRHEEEVADLCTDKDIEEAEKDIEQFSGRKIVLDECQKNAIKSAFQNKITVITGGGGTGKSTICRCIYHLAEEKKLSVRMMSPTGKAAQVLTAKTSFPAGTIHRSLKMKPDDDFPKENIKEDIIVVDEVSMVGIDTMFAVMCALEDNLWGNLILVGDANQLPSVSPGNFLTDLMKSGCVNVIKLDKIHRQDEKSFIAILANDVSKGKIVTIPEDASDIKWHDLAILGDFDITIRRVVKDFIDRNNVNDLQFLSCMYKGNFGVNRINEIVQDLMSEINNTKDKSLKHGFQHFYIGDRVIQTENNYEKEIFNGDIGTIVDLGRKALDPSVSDEAKDFTTVDFYGKNIRFVDKEIDQLKLAWCCTVHKFQGSQSPYIIFVFSKEANIMESKEILYTAMTRAEKHLDIYGHREVFRMSPTKSVIRKRYTNMNNIIQELRENRKIIKVSE